MANFEAAHVSTPSNLFSDGHEPDVFPGPTRQRKTLARDGVRLPDRRKSHGSTLDALLGTPSTLVSDRWLVFPPRIASKLHRPDGPAGCWLWTGYVKPDGYATFKWYGRTEYVHRIVWELLLTPVPDGLELDHLCHVPRCCNPAHMEPVTKRVNVQRARARNRT